MSTVVVQPSPTTVVVQPSTTTVVSTSAANRVVTTDNSNTVISTSVEGKILSVVSAGPQGATGATGAGGEDEVAYRKTIDFIDDDTLYKGEADPGTLKAEALWRIQYIVINPTTGDTEISWADGTAAFDKIWDNRLGYTNL